MSNVEQVIYVSRARPGLGADDLARILASARRRNPAQGLTGFLAFHGQAFLQVLEGSPAALTSCLASLVTDETGTGSLVFSILPTLQGFISNASSTIAALTAYGNGQTT